MKFSLILFLFCHTVFSLPSSVIQVVAESRTVIVSQDETRPWALHEVACVQLQNGPHCGEIMMANPNRAILRFNEWDSEIEKELKIVQPVYSPAQQKQEVVKYNEDELIDAYRAFFHGNNEVYIEPKKNKDKLLGVGTYYKNPYLRVEYKTRPTQSGALLIGYEDFFLLNWFRGNRIETTLLGVSAIYNFYEFLDFGGWWWQLGMGYCFGNTTYLGKKSDTSGFSFLATTGYRWTIDDMNFGAFWGAQVHKLSRRDETTLLMVYPVIGLEATFLY